MKTLTILFSMIFALAASAGAATPPIDVTVADADGKVAFKGKTKADGTFATPKLKPGNYIVQFNSTNVKSDHAIVVSAGKKKVTADSVAGSKFAGGGVAMKVDVGAGLGINGQVAEVGTVMADRGRKVKVMNGKRYVWIEGETGTNVRGRWVEEGSAAARSMGTMDRESVSFMQDRSGQGAAPGAGR
jgi:hypothetical protein